MFKDIEILHTIHCINTKITAKHYDLKEELKFVFEHVHLWPFVEVSLRQRDLSFVPSCKTEIWDLGGDCMDCQALSLDPCSSPESSCTREGTSRLQSYDLIIVSIIICIPVSCQSP